MMLSSLSALAVAALSVGSTPPSYHATLLPQLDQHDGSDGQSLVYTWGNAINDARTVVGQIGGTYEAFVWSASSGAVYFQPEDAAESWAGAITSTGQVVGAYTPEGVFGQRAFTYSNGTFTPLPSFVAGLSAGAIDINESGMMVGWAERAPGGTFGGPQTAVYWINGQVHEIGNLGGSSGTAVAINNSNVAAGYSNTPGPPALKPFRWTQAGGIEVLPQLVNGVPAVPADINDAGIIVGRAGVSLFANEAVYWDTDDSIHPLPRLHNTSDIGVLAINNDGVMVGQEMAPDAFPEARLWWDGAAYNLQDLATGIPEGYRLLEATGINDNGDIIATALTVVGKNIQHFTVMLIPAACPADTDGSGGVDVDDLVTVILGWGACAPPADCPGDVNDSGAVDVDDLVAVILAWGPCE
jgi:uncharacterized membrane protein